MTGSMLYSGQIPNFFSLAKYDSDQVFPVYGFGADFGNFGNNFATAFDFGADFGADFGNFGDFFASSISTEFEDNVSCASSANDRSRRQQQRRQ